jgi:hypothetical protein
LSADHEFKAGAQFENGHHDSYMVSPNGVFQYQDYSGVPYQAIYRGPFLRAGKFSTGGVFVDDSIRVRGRLTVNVGARFDHSRAISPDLPARDDGGHTTGAIVRGLGTLFKWDVLSPRSGFALKLTADGRTVLRGSYGRFHQGILTGELVSVYPGQAPQITARFDSASGQYYTFSILDPKTNVAIDSHMRSPYSDQISLSLDRDLSRRLAVSVAYVGKKGNDLIGWRDTGGIYQKTTSTLPDGRPFPTFNLVNDTADRRFLLTNPAGYFLRYNGITVTVQTRGNSHWWGLTSYTLSRAEGLQVSSSTAPGNPQYTYEVGNAGYPAGLSFGRDPNDLTNARGALPNDRTHVLRAMGSLSISRTKLVIAGNFQYLTGLPWAATTSLNLPQGLQRILLEPRGSRRLSSQKLLDLRLSKPLHLGERAQAELLLDVLNVLNSTAEEGLFNDDLFSTNFGRPNLFVDPRRAMFGVRFILGR